MSEIKIGSKVTCPVTDGKNENGFVIGMLKAINSRYATIETDGKTIKVGKTKIELIEIEEPVTKIKKEQTGVTCRAASGRISRDNNDTVAAALRGKSLESAYDIAAKHLKTKAITLKLKYGHLNPGQQRMCLGNRIRGKK